MQITRTTPLRRITLQLRHIFLTDAETFIVFSFKRWLRVSAGSAQIHNQLALKLAFFNSDSYCWLIT